MWRSSRSALEPESADNGTGVGIRTMLVALSLLVCVAACEGADTDQSEGLTPSTTASPEQNSIPAGTGPIEPGTYYIPKSEWSLVDFSVRFPKGWTAEDGHTYLKHSGGDDELSFYAVQVD